MSLFLRTYLAALTVVWATSASAGLMAPVYVGGKAWMQPIDFVDYGWVDIAGVCNPLTGVCNGSLGSIDLTGLTWASQLDIDGLYEAVIPDLWPGGVTSVFYFDNPVSPEFNNFFDVYGFVPVFDGSIALGRLRQINAYLSDSAGLQAAFLATDYIAENVYIAANNGDYEDGNNRDVGGWFFRAVPAPATFYLMFFGLAFLGLRRIQRLRV